MEWLYPLSSRLQLALTKTSRLYKETAPMMLQNDFENL
ncbi:hypothetical protein BVRB_2g028950 [Beta vulgaris subsp. vulgaris]|nr:hypothetical protein BVRB_2g028950 [Beta vulgaris subsp. vulgaris]